jgi:hypothetical protein
MPRPRIAAVAAVVDTLPVVVAADMPVAAVVVDTSKSR